jgi:hypothetical protein
MYSSKPAAYACEIDAAVLRNGQPARRLGSATAGAADRAHWIKDDYNVKPYVGRKVKLTAMIKSKDVTGSAGLACRIMDGHFTLLTPIPPKPIRGTSDWQRYEAVLRVPPETQLISAGVVLYGRGTIWFDEVHWEPAD